MNKKNELSFEENLKELENIVDQLESGDIDLEKSIKLYEKVMLLKKTLLISAYKPPIIIANPPYHRRIFF